VGVRNLLKKFSKIMLVSSGKKQPYHDLKNAKDKKQKGQKALLRNETL